ncbi:peptidylprolyl isomerase [Allocoleopsis franciscana]|uniref:Peptidyl-prolyl cis-trans isomerase n=1 Tax=Allocoleopsis franciscana PCC 7113 TaxID=1173027 RepID=K9WNE9_9CYAN|nr:peptidylprolyl isomerase [Allocoleopsis franciscana]AFZ21336.1 peptidyl-prolyl cis-trans isomerase (rotamase) - cyclophilin family [Allocoleopsis franciscana PCC 7113]
MQIKIQRWLSILLIVVGLVMGGCSTQEATPLKSSNPKAAETASAPAAERPSSQQSNLPRLDGKATVVLKVKGSPITIEVDGTNAPITAGNFVDLVQRGVYNGLVFHRVVRNPEPFVVQGGDPQGKDEKFPVERLGTGGFIDPQTKQERYVPLEIKPKDAQEPIYSQTFEKAGITVPPQLKHTRGAVAMARSTPPDSASSQFYISLAELQFLDGNYAVFGYVTDGMNVVDKIQQGDRIESAKVTKGIENLKK